ncbi:hypothetical protein [Streptomyces sp. NBC_01187]|uniref:hypothetical protein n=1 Tax=Streptomyces sp. NBC_01187 TaxID=2903766 RepID=UPI00386DB559|nr:hypothetical protein OG220_21095 [Streptomyces sp. NBC_01187]
MRAQKLTLTALALVAGLSLTACGGSEDSSSSKDASGSSSSKVANESEAKSGGGKGQGSGDDVKTQSGRKGAASGTWFGNVKYLAPGKYTVSDMKGVEKAFFTSKATNIQGAGDICGDADGQAAQKCTEAELEAASKKGVSATVKIKNGIAVSVIEDHSSSSGSGGGKGGGKGAASGTWFGNVKYLAPGKYTVSDMKGVEKAFFTSKTTNIQGAGDICGDADGQAAQKCTEAELEAASKKGVSATVKIKNGIAVSVIEDH